MVENNALAEDPLAEDPPAEEEPESLEPTPLSGPATEVREASLIPVDSRLLVDIDGVGEHLESRLVGILPGQTLIVETPATTQPIRDQFYLNRKVVVRFVAAGEVRGFRSRIAHSISRPCELLFLSYPESFEQVTLRR